jgi:phosphosulfolactate phosphohydrolase-like enzyme
MKIETILTPAELPALAQRDLRATACVVFDVLRATSTFVTALHHGAQAIIPVSEIAEALAFKKSEVRSQKSEVILLGGERNGVRISADGIDFDLGNSPREYTPEKVRGKTIVSTTTNGTRALRACIGAKTILASSFLNLTATAEFLRQNRFETILLICAGTHENEALEDVLASGALCELLLDSPGSINPVAADVSPLHLKSVEVRADSRRLLRSKGSKRESFERVEVAGLDDSSQIARRAWLEAKSDLSAAIGRSQNGARLLAIPELREDVAFCLQRDIFPLIAKMENDGSIRVSRS